MPGLARINVLILESKDDECYFEQNVKCSCTIYMPLFIVKVKLRRRIQNGTSRKIEARKFL